MKKVILLLCSIIFFANTAFAAGSCFIAKDNSVVIKREGDCNTRYSPCSTFKIALALMGYDDGILKDEMHPEWPFKPEYEAFLESWKNPQNPTSWMKNSCVWYSQVVTPQLGMKKFQDYVKEFNYGNQDLSGDKGQDNGLTNAWLSSSLEISPEEQTIFLQKLVDHKLPVGKASYDKTKKIMFIQELPGGWKLYGKTGNGLLRDKDDNKTDLQHGWFVGYIEKGNQRIVFASHITYDEKQNVCASFRARNEALNKLWYLINELEK